MIKDFYIFENLNIHGENTLVYGDRVIIKYNSSEYFNKTGTVSYVRTNGPNVGDCSIILDTGVLVEFYYTNLAKILDLVGVPSGEILSIFFKDINELYMEGIVRYNKMDDYYFFKDDDKWYIESYSL